MGGVASSPGEHGGCVLRHGSAEDVGGRRTMEDAHSAAAGEGGGCPERCRGFYVGSAFQRVDAAFAAAVDAGRLAPSGTTALAVAVIGSSIVVANAGDCRAVLSRAGRAQILTNDHRPSCPAERARVEAAGGTVTPDGYLNGDLSVSRAIGDFHLPGMKDGGAGPLISRPEIVEVAIDDDCEFLVLASDGVFDAMTAHTLVAVARAELRRSNDPGRASQEVVSPAGGGTGGMGNRPDRRGHTCQKRGGADGGPSPPSRQFPWGQYVGRRGNRRYSPGAAVLGFRPTTQ
ncbi:uncharacterized protein [Pocillopora verrucosa]|uniref:uncharacterized protein n=1 Tax=Pocillopora verrucosa TaxID=203993 RepID=UPI00333F7E03